MQTGRNDRKVEKSISMHLHAFERSYKRQVMTDTKSRNALHLLVIYDFFDQTVSLTLDGLMLSVLKEAEGIRNRLMKMMLHL